MVCPKCGYNFTPTRIYTARRPGLLVPVVTIIYTYCPKCGAPIYMPSFVEG